ncbi:hypothetical protein ACFJIX_21630 [Roseateles sp. UC29_93]|uniref:hypothetical protein n=1 Tax=Roseateles sp. UC29_93 TaxID=3350177 RepID=UPI00366ABB99
MTKLMTDESIKALIEMPKTVRNPRTRWIEQKRSMRRTFDAESVDGRFKFRVYQRQNLEDPDAFSCGLSLLDLDGEEVTLVRCNGPYHSHGNPLEGERLDFLSHVHFATERYMAEGRKAEHFAIRCDAYVDLCGATRHLAGLCAIANLPLTAHAGGELVQGVFDLEY